MYQYINFVPALLSPQSSKRGTICQPTIDLVMLTACSVAAPNWSNFSFKIFSCFLRVEWNKSVIANDEVFPFSSRSCGVSGWYSRLQISPLLMKWNLPGSSCLRFLKLCTSFLLLARSSGFLSYAMKMLQYNQVTCRIKRR